MLKHPSADDWSLSPAQAEYVDAACNGFEAAWKSAAQGGERPQIEQYLAASPKEAREVLLQELLDLELAYRRKLGEQPTLEEYRQRFPDFLGQVSLSRQRLLGGEPGESGEQDRCAGGQTVEWTGPAELLDNREHNPGSAATIPPGQPLQEAPSLPRLSVPGYEILEEVGRGGMGIVYKARQASLKRLVALKMIRDSTFAGPDQRARFYREAEAVARLQHANVIHIHQIGEHQGLPFFAMEFAEGGNLADKLGGKPLPAAQAAELVKTLALAVDHAHRRNVIHRDLKPANVLLSGDGRPLLADFGLAKLLDKDAGLSRSGAVLGTASYLAPEQAEGKTREVGPAADVYALGAILYELLAGRPPFKADTWQATIYCVIHDEPVRPSQLQPDVPLDLENICLRCLDKNPAQRYDRAAVLAEDLSRFLSGEPVGPFPVCSPLALPGYEMLEPLTQGDERVRLFKVREAASGRLACLKVLRDLIKPDDLARFQRTVLPVLDRLQLPNLVRIHACGVCGGWVYLVQEFLPGGSLRRRIGDDPQPVRESAVLVESLARTMQIVHDHGLVHGNLEPANVLLESDGTPRIAEIGLVNQPGRSSTWPDDALTRSMISRASLMDLDQHGFVGNLRYLAPEACYSDTNPQSDIYGLGAILYHMLTGRPPIVGDSLPHLMAQVLKRAPAPPRQLRAEVPAELEAVCLRCLQKEPPRRYPSAAAVAEALRRFLNGPAGQEKAKPTPAARA